ncbi:MAG: hypothetical protein Rubg2KO_07650 [Rubricoccaceae bacterium]
MIPDLDVRGMRQHIHLRSLMTALPTRLLFILALSVLMLPAAQAQRSLANGPQVERMGNFEIQDLIVEINYAESRRGRAQATVTIRPPEAAMELDKSSTKLMALVARSTNGRTARIPLRVTDDGTLTGTGTLPTLGTLDELALMADRETGLRFGIPVYDGRQGWNIEQGSAWKVDEGETLTGMREGNGWRIDITIETDPPVIVIVVEGD